MKRTSKILSLLLVGVLSFLLFLYLLFPFQILKEAVSTKLSEISGFNIKILVLKPDLPLGIQAERVIVSVPGRGGFEFREVSANLSLLSLLIARLSAELELVDKDGGSLEVTATFGLFDLLSSSLLSDSGISMPKNIEVVSENFDLGEPVNFVFMEKAKDPNTDPMLKSLFDTFRFQGKLNASVNFSVNVDDLTKTTGDVKIGFANMQLNIVDPTLALPSQIFSKAMINAKLEQGVLTLEKTSELLSNDLQIAFNGTLSQKPELDKSMFDMGVRLELKEALKKQFSWVLNLASGHGGGDGDGVVEIKIEGPLSPGPTITVL